MQSSTYEDMLYYEEGSNSSHLMPELAFNNNNNNKLIPKGDGSTSGAGKSIRKRSGRSSKKSPATTLLNANPNNFRALVQQFTGCHSTPTPPAIFGGNKTAYKGPITLNFAQHKQQYNCPSRSENLDHKYLSHDHIQQQWNTMASTAPDEHEVHDQSFFSFTTNSMADVTTTTTNDDHDLFGVSAVNNYEPRPDPLNDFDLENLSLQQLSSGPHQDDYSGTRNYDDDPVFWEY